MRELCGSAHHARVWPHCSTHWAKATPPAMLCVTVPPPRHLGEAEHGHRDPRQTQPFASFAASHPHPRATPSLTPASRDDVDQFHARERISGRVRAASTPADRDDAEAWRDASRDGDWRRPGQLQRLRLIDCKQSSR